MKYFLGLVCRKMCSINLKDRLKNKKKSSGQNIFEKGFSVQKFHEREVNIFPHKLKILGVEL